MTDRNPFGARSTADQVLAGIDLTGRVMIVTGCTSGIGFETMNALAANGAQVVGLARSLTDAERACRVAGSSCTPIACDLGDLGSIASAAAAIRNLAVPLDAIVANAAVAHLPTLELRNGVEMQFMVNYVGHFALVSRLSDLVRDGSGRIVIVSDGAGIDHAPAEGIMFDNLDGHTSYQPPAFYGQSKLAAAVYARELSRRLQHRGIAVNSVDPGATRGTRLNKSLHGPLAFLARLMRPFMRNARRGAATQALLAASPRVAGITGEYWTDCRIAVGSRLLHDDALAQRLWEISERLVVAATQPAVTPLQAAA